MSLRKAFPVVLILFGLIITGMLYIQYQWLHYSISAKQALRQKMVSGINYTLRHYMEKQPAAALLNAGYPDNNITSLKAALNKAFAALGIPERNIELAFKGDGRQGFTDYITPGFNTRIGDTARNTILTFYDGDPNTGSPGYKLIVVLAGVRNGFLQHTTWRIVGVIICDLLLVFVFVLFIASYRRQQAFNRYRQQVVAQLANDLINPITSLSIAADALNNEKVCSDADKNRYYSNVIRDTQNQLHNHLEKVFRRPASFFRAPIRRIFH